MKISILIPTRNRISDLRRLLNSIHCKTFNLNSIELIVCVDFDDKKTIEYLLNNKHSWFKDIKLIIRKQADNMSDDYYNLMAKASSGDLLWVLNDDCEINTQNWDYLISKKVKELKYKIFYLDIDDSTRNFNNDGCSYSCFPMISREAFNKLGYFFIPVIKGWSADKYLFDLYNGIDRVVPMQEVFVIHHREASDDNYEKMARLFEEDRPERQTLNMPLRIKEFKEVIERTDKVYETYKEMYDDYWKYYFPVHSSFMNHVPVTWLINSPLKFDSVLEIGSGNGESIQRLIRAGKNARGIEYSHWLYDNYLRFKFPKGEVIEGDVTKIPFKRNNFDVVCSFDVLEHLPEKNVERAISEIYRVTKKYFFGTISHNVDHYEKFHTCVKSRAWWMYQFIKIGFNIINIEPKPNYPIFVFEKGE